MISKTLKTYIYENLNKSKYHGGSDPAPNCLNC